jgi:hypothetical protein
MLYQQLLDAGFVLPEDRPRNYWIVAAVVGIKKYCILEAAGQHRILPWPFKASRVIVAKRRVDISALEKIVVSISDMFPNHPEIRRMDVNLLIVHRRRQRSGYYCTRSYLSPSGKNDKYCMRRPYQVKGELPTSENFTRRRNISDKGRRNNWTMYKKFMKIIEINAEDLAKNLLQEIQKKDEFRHYQEISKDVSLERIFQVIRNVYERLGRWLDENKSKNTLFAYYSDLGVQRFREGIPLDELILLFHLIKREIWHVFREQMDSDVDHKHLMEIDFYVNLYFDRVVTAIITGYQNELGKIIETSCSDNPLILKIFKRE